MEASQRPVNSQQNSTLNENQPKTAQQCPRKTSQSAEVQQVLREVPQYGFIRNRSAEKSVREHPICNDPYAQFAGGREDFSFVSCGDGQTA